MIEPRTYVGIAGLNYIQHEDLVLRPIIRVCREGLGYTETPAIPASGERAFLYQPMSGKIIFGDAFNGLEKVSVIVNIT
jgi:hypothetical protein